MNPRTAAPSPSRSGQPDPAHVGREQPSRAFLALNRMTRSQLETVLIRGQTPDPDALAGWEFRGMNTPLWARAVGIKKFVKGFYRPSGNRRELFGYNCPVVQDGLERPWRVRSVGQPSERFGFYRVCEVDAASRDNTYLHAYLLDYSQGQNPALDPSAGLRDYLVQVEPDNPDIFLGKAYYALAGARIPVSYFALERLRPGPADPHL